MLSHEELSIIAKETDSRLCLPDQQLILDDTYFGIAVSGKVPNCLLREIYISQAKWVKPEMIKSEEEPEKVWIYQTDAQEEKETETIDGCEACTQRHMLEDQLNILVDKEHLGITKSEWQQVDDV